MISIFALAPDVQAHVGCGRAVRGPLPFMIVRTGEARPGQLARIQKDYAPKNRARKVASA